MRNPRDGLSSVMIKDLVSLISFTFLCQEQILFLHSLLTSKTHARTPTAQPSSIKLALRKASWWTEVFIKLCLHPTWIRLF